MTPCWKSVKSSCDALLWKQLPWNTDSRLCLILLLIGFSRMLLPVRVCLENWPVLVQTAKRRCAVRSLKILQDMLSWIIRILKALSRPKRLLICKYVICIGTVVSLSWKRNTKMTECVFVLTETLLGWQECGWRLTRLRIAETYELKLVAGIVKDL